MSTNSQWPLTEEELQKADVERALRKDHDPWGRRRADDAHRRDFEQQKVVARTWGETWAR